MLDEVEKVYGASHRPNTVRGRKEERQAKRKGPAPREHDEAPRKKARPAAEPKAKEGKAKAEPKAKAEAKHEKEGKSKPEKKSKKELVLPEDDKDVEDREIAWLEYMIKNEGGEEAGLEDGLDDILDFAERMEHGKLRRDELGDSDDEDGMGEFEISESEEEDEDEDEDSEEVDESDGEESGEEQEVDLSEDDSENEGAEEEWHGIADSDSEPEPEPKPEIIPEEPKAETAVPAPGRYVPPHLRAAMLAEKAAGDGARAAERAKLERKAQGLLNKLSEVNIESILTEVEKLFGEYSRNDVTATLTNQIILMIGSKTNLLDSFVVLYATLVGALHRVVGLEFGAHFVQTLVNKYNDEFARTAPTSTSADGDDAAKEAFNLLTLIAELFNAGVIGSQLVYDLVRGFIGEGEGELMSERGVEGLLKILKCSGSQLRADDAASLKGIVSLVQERTRGRDKEMTVRAKFMIETLGNLRSGKSKGLGTERPDVTRMRKFLSGMGKKRRLLAPEPLRVGLKDLLSADSRGKWWLVGAGWSGNPLLERQPAKKAEKMDERDREDEEVLLELARKQGMNTDVRRSAFVVLLSSEDYVHACDRLHAFRLTQVQQRDFVRVALHCVGMETTYNPYYTLVLNNLCANSYDHRFTLQYALWDLLRELADGGVDDTRASHVARALAFLIARGSVDLTIFKAVEFTDISKGTRKMLDSLLRTLLLSIHTASPLLTLPKKFKVEDADLETVEATFDKALAAPELAGGLTWILQSIRKNPGKGVGALEGEIIGVGAEVASGVLARAI
ncbi:hypothetical protein CcaverHIS002_0206400 [Cutaneotrichosporon cavernicola]|uniref:MI domain-containing protein n=1 Tax=Cutaneotrichosporon cavernicola TaxID=279322 RepID=A0AA48I7H4_9TREE|nr:uncharacterized protein CcaverHIS019_0206370 [Cutaneotrichosporon cavernicola]BEI81480.1 hypothetical protein CcaverHIS002_0206400 [Cutaneotrichosporon cavernicola]BEI89275.1 hypothetical protein CcaverHIS019_0206370 [Cutaneotrichosporon cavernicola]BEI97051.1 hypothetical protein CcaverHIS631_0206400 [Cutaneotrichosporon cavernicola]BEJ04824.1 hypothetical protein CcaverHIS641_0206410 [Cutaneotrichosporon cavernicola]